MRICKQISTGKLIEMQSSAKPGTLTANAIAAGYSASDIEEHDGTMAEFYTLLGVALPPPP